MLKNAQNQNEEVWPMKTGYRTHLNKKWIVKGETSIIFEFLNEIIFEFLIHFCFVQYIIISIEY